MWAKYRPKWAIDVAFSLRGVRGGADWPYVAYVEEWTGLTWRMWRSRLTLRSGEEDVHEEDEELKRAIETSQRLLDDDDNSLQVSSHKFLLLQLILCLQLA
ncbi:unnamed protein product [Toxocara canis]|uniref:Uncharacterized protein n=1 Tax=Toxocara canis TaxID=6265 RepID=A0A183U9M6_TOXCA|nr:unnamed protein product [Toxocara canis]